MAKSKKKIKDLDPKSRAKNVKGGVTVGGGKDGALNRLGQANVGGAVSALRRKGI